MISKGHFCYGCNTFFHDSNPYVKTHKGCTGNKSIGICVDRMEFGEDYVGNLLELSKDELIKMILKTSKNKNNKIYEKRNKVC